jgi:hypothetical protein
MCVCEVFDLSSKVEPGVGQSKYISKRPLPIAHFPKEAPFQNISKRKTQRYLTVSGGCKRNQ